jgi:hypothetical protein
MGAHLQVEAVAVHAQIARGVVESDDAGLQIGHTLNVGGSSLPGSL